MTGLPDTEGEGRSMGESESGITLGKISSRCIKWLPFLTEHKKVKTPPATCCYKYTEEAKKKASPRTQEVSDQRGRLSLAVLLKLLSDVFTEIASHFEPRDLLHLARSSKHSKCGAKAEFTNSHHRLCKVCFRGCMGLGPSRGDIGLFRSLLEAQGVEPRVGGSGGAELDLISALVLESGGARMNPYDL